MWAAHGIVPVAREMQPCGACAPRRVGKRNDSLTTAATAVNALAAALELAYNPLLLGVELLSAIETLGCMPGATLSPSAPPSGESAVSGSAVALPLGLHERKHWSIIGPAPTNPTDSIFLAEEMQTDRKSVV